MRRATVRLSEAHCASVFFVLAAVAVLVGGFFHMRPNFTVNADTLRPAAGYELAASRCRWGSCKVVLVHREHEDWVTLFYPFATVFNPLTRADFVVLETPKCADGTGEHGVDGCYALTRVGIERRGLAVLGWLFGSAFFVGLAHVTVRAASPKRGCAYRGEPDAEKQ